jgi:hypothetical protein
MRATTKIAQSDVKPAPTPRPAAALSAEKCREAFERQSKACEDKLPSGVRQRWRRLAQLMIGLAPALPKASGSSTAMQFYIPDGPYRKQVFALHVRKDGSLAAYTGDVLKDACQTGLLVRPPRGAAANAYRIADGESLVIDAIDGRTPNQEPFYTAMTGWNRRAICIMLPVSASAAQLASAESLCTLSAAAWRSNG